MNEPTALILDLAGEHGFTDVKPSFFPKTSEEIATEVSASIGSEQHIYFGNESAFVRFAEHYFNVGKHMAEIGSMQVCIQTAQACGFKRIQDKPALHPSARRVIDAFTAIGRILEDVSPAERRRVLAAVNALYSEFET